MGTLYGYVRVSTQEQNEDRQLISMKEMGIENQNIFMDKQSGKDFERNNYRRDHRAVEDSYQREKNRYRSAGYAHSRHQTGERPDGNFFERYCIAGAFFCSGK